MTVYRITHKDYMIETILKCAYVPRVTMIDTSAVDLMAETKPVYAVIQIWTLFG